MHRFTVTDEQRIMFRGVLFFFTHSSTLSVCGKQRSKIELKYENLVFIMFGGQQIISIFKEF